MQTCRCPICGRKDADSTRSRRAYIRAGVIYSEIGPVDGKREGRRQLRRYVKAETAAALRDHYPA